MLKFEYNDRQTDRNVYLTKNNKIHNDNIYKSAVGGPPIALYIAALVEATMAHLITYNEITNCITKELCISVHT